MDTSRRADRDWSGSDPGDVSGGLCHAPAFAPDLVLYVEAVNKVCTVHMLNRTMVIRQPITVREAVTALIK